MNSEECNKIACTRRIKIPVCLNCGELLELQQEKSTDGTIYLFWYCQGNQGDDGCESNGDVLPEFTENYSKGDELNE